MSFVIDVAVYLALSGAAFWLVVWLWRHIFGTVQTRPERGLFWGTWVGLSVLAAGWYHALTGDRDFGFALMLLALAVALVVDVGANVVLAVTFRKPYAPERDPVFLAEMEERRRSREENTRHYLAELRGELAAPDERRLLR